MKLCKKILGLTVAFATLFALGCSKIQNTSSIQVISREAGSGTRGAFIELMGIEVKNADGKKVDLTSDEAEITNSTEVVISTVKNSKNAIGYISLGSLNNSVKALKIDGVAPSVSNIKNGTYSVSRPFNIVTKNLSDAASEFYRFILSKQGQEIIEKNGYIAVAQNPDYMANVKNGKVSVAGSSSVYPVMEKLAEKFRELNPNIIVEVSQSDSTTGVTSAIEGIADIGMASRELKQSELDKGVIATKIAIDGIAIIVNKENSIDNATKEQIKNIYVGELTTWQEL